MVTPEFNVAYRIDSNGRRQHSRDNNATPERRLLLFGDSFAEGWGVDVDDGLAARLDVELPSFQVTNFGTAGYGTDQELLLFQQEGESLDPDLVIVLFYGNDLWNNVSRRGIGARRTAKPVFRPDANGVLRLQGTPIPITEPEPPDWRRTLIEHVHLAALVQRALADAPLASRQMRDFYGGLYTEDPRFSQVWFLTESLLREFRRRVEAAGSAFRLVYIPAIVQVETDNWESKQRLHELTGTYDLDLPNRRLHNITTRLGIDFTDLTPGIRAAAQDRRLYFDDSHWNEEGHAVAAGILADVLRRDGIDGVGDD